jgi:hypothetical protein
MTDARERIIELLAEGESLSAICRMSDMPAWSTVHVWMDEDQEFAGRITRAREIGYQARAERAVLDAKCAEDAAKGRLAFDAERWFLGKLSNAFSDKQKHELTGKDGGPVETLNKVERHVIDPQNPNS